MTRANTTKSFKIPGSLEIEMNKKLVSEGYGLRGKSNWICDAICKFLSFPDREFILDCIELSEELKNLDKSISFRPTLKVENLLDEWIINVRMKLPTIEGLKSKIIRTSIIHSLLGSIESIETLGKQSKKNIEYKNATL
ncbi:MAG: hypothetical protein NTU49_01490 [Gammaproteobacteria bacterium]|nr:hypothetical protein [Gammaproteobacteria bacterium]